MSAVGADVESLCRKCGDVWHVVVAKVGEQIAKVQCKECGSLHKHRPPGGAKPKGPSVARRRTGAATKSSATKASAPPRFEPALEPDLSKPIRPYSIRELFSAGERVDHPKFGIGIVEQVTAPGKIEVFFPDGRRVLAQAKKKESEGLSALGSGPPRWMQPDSE